MKWLLSRLFRLNKLAIASRHLLVAQATSSVGKRGDAENLQLQNS